MSGPTLYVVLVAFGVVVGVASGLLGVGDLGLALRFGVVGAVGSVLGALLALALPGSTLRLVFAIFVGLVGLRLARDGIRGEEGAEA